MNKLKVMASSHFSLTVVRTVPVVIEGDFRLELSCSPADRRIVDSQHNGTADYQAIEGEAIVRLSNGREDVGSGRLVSVSAGLLSVPAARAAAG